MVSTPYGLSGAARAQSILAAPCSSRAIDQVRSRCNFSFVMILVCITFATVLVPERPNELASICKKHNPAIACQVW